MHAANQRRWRGRIKKGREGYEKKGKLISRRAAEAKRAAEERLQRKVKNVQLCCPFLQYPRPMQVQPPIFPYCKTSVLKWQSRRHKLLEEILAYEADVVCLQDVDHEDWWLPQLQPAGYDSVHQADTLDDRICVAIFFKRSLSTVFVARYPIRRRVVVFGRRKE